ncbi:MAG: ABC transporter ATP-binding protein [Bacteroidales bacterium]
MSSALEVRNLQIGYNHHNREFCAGPLSFSLQQGELAMLIGPNGVGKSTLLRTLARLTRPISGEIFINAIPMESIARSEMARFVAFVSTETSFPFYLSIYDLIALGRIPYLNWLGRLTDFDRRIVDRAIEQMQLGHLKNKQLQEVSDGERQKALIARALAQDTPLILLDEPTAFLDLVNKHNIIHLLSDIAHQQQKTVLLTTHDLNIAIAEADRLLIMHDNNFLSGAPEDLQLKNQINLLFKRQYRFDPLTGMLKRQRVAQHKVIVVVPPSVSRTVARLTQKALERVGYEVVEEESNIRIIIHKHDEEYQWIIELKGSRSSEAIVCADIYTLCRRLSDLRQTD